MAFDSKLDFVSIVRSMSGRELADLHSAFAIERDKHSRGLDFCDTRLNAIVAELIRRASTGRLAQAEAEKGEG